MTCNHNHDTVKETLNCQNVFCFLSCRHTVQPSRSRPITNAAISLIPSFIAYAHRRHSDGTRNTSISPLNITMGVNVGWTGLQRLFETLCSIQDASNTISPAHSFHICVADELDCNLSIPKSCSLSPKVWICGVGFQRVELFIARVNDRGIHIHCLCPF